MAITKADYVGIARELTTAANRSGANVKAKCARCFDTIMLVSKNDDSDAVAEKLYAHKSVCSRTILLIH